MIYRILSDTNVLWPHMSSLRMSVSGTLLSSHIWMSLALSREAGWCKPSSPDKTVADKWPPHLEEQILLHCYYCFLHACVLCMGSHRQTCVCIRMGSQGTLDVFLDCLPSSALSSSLTLNLESTTSACLANQLGLRLPGTEDTGGSPHPLSFYVDSGIWIIALLS